jgi:cytoskeletal protein CcmA (bactofilin family)
MPGSKRDTVEVACPRCGHVQPEPRTAYSTICRKCREHFRVQEVLRPAAKAAVTEIPRRTVRCFQCETEVEVAVAAASTMCKRCSSHIDLGDYQITATVSKNFRTHGRLIIEEKGYVLNTEALVGDAVVKGRLIGKLAAEHSLEIYSTANIKGSFTAGKLIIPSGQHLRWPEPIRVGSAEVLGELVGSLQSPGTVILRASARFFGEVLAKSLVVEAGAVFVGSARTGGS